MAEAADLVNCKPEELQPWPSATIKIVAKNLKRLCLAELGCENPGTAWDSILKRDVAYRRAGNRQEAYHIAFLLNMTTEEMQRYFSSPVRKRSACATRWISCASPSNF